MQVEHTWFQSFDGYGLETRKQRSYWVAAAKLIILVSIFFIMNRLKQTKTKEHLFFILATGFIFVIPNSEMPLPSSAMEI